MGIIPCPARSLMLGRLSERRRAATTIFLAALRLHRQQDSCPLRLSDRPSRPDYPSITKSGTGSALKPQRGIHHEHNRHIQQKRERV